jgi:hypothetical protein
MVVVAWGNSTRTRTSGAASAGGRPNFHEFLVRRLGSPCRPFHFFANAFLRPLTAPSFGGFWREWNPPLGDVLLFGVYRPRGGTYRVTWPGTSSSSSPASCTAGENCADGGLVHSDHRVGRLF